MCLTPVIGSFLGGLPSVPGLTPCFRKNKLKFPFNEFNEYHHRNIAKDYIWWLLSTKKVRKMLTPENAKARIWISPSIGSASIVFWLKTLVLTSPQVVTLSQLHKLEHNKTERTAMNFMIAGVLLKKCHLKLDWFGFMQLTFYINRQLPISI